MQQRSQTKLAGMLGLGMCSLLLLLHVCAFFYIAHEMVHECEGEHCHTCECIEMCEVFLQQVSGLLPLVIAFLLSYSVCVHSVIILKNICRHTPVSTKVRLNN